MFPGPRTGSGVLLGILLASSGCVQAPELLMGPNMNSMEKVGISLELKRVMLMLLMQMRG
jgi:hypothetical protein